MSEKPIEKRCELCKHWSERPPYGDKRMCRVKIDPRTLAKLPTYMVIADPWTKATDGEWCGVFTPKPETQP